MHPSKIAFAIALVASPLSMMPPSGHPTGSSFTAIADRSVTKSEVGGRPLVDAPLSKLGPDKLPAVDRVAQPGSHALDAGPINGTPFSSTPTGTLSEGGSQIAQGDRSLSAADNTGVVPNLGR